MGADDRFVYRPALKMARVSRFLDKQLIPLPKYQSVDAAGMDLCADVDASTIIPAGEVKLIPTGLKMEIPRGYEGQIRPRSGLATKRRLTIVNSPGTIDADFRAEVMVALINLSDIHQYVDRGERIAQLVIAPIVQVVPTLVDESELSVTARGDGGFGSTGSK